MKNYSADKIINIALAGHSGSGKTTLAESMLYIAKASDRLGKVSQGNTICDYDPEEVKRQVSVFTSIAPFEWKGHKINLIDTPGLFDFAAGLYEGTRAADSLIVTIAGKSGVQVGTEKAVEAADSRGLTKIFFVSGLSDESSRFYDVLGELRDAFGPSICPVVVPHFVDGKIDCYIDLLDMKAYAYNGVEVSEVEIPETDKMDDMKNAIYEAVAQTSEEMFDKYFAGEEFTHEEVIKGLSKGFREGSVSPVFCGDAFTSGVGILMDAIVELAPTAKERAAEMAEDENGDLVEVAVDENGKTAAIVFKTVSDPFIGKLSYFKVVSGKVIPGKNLYNMRTGKEERITKVLTVKGKKQEEAKEICAGDIGAFPKLQATITGDTLCAQDNKVRLEPVEYPNFLLSMAIYPKAKGEEDKVAAGCIKLCEEDATLSFKNNLETHEMILSGLGEQHLDVVVSRLKDKFAVDAELRVPKIAYRETIKSKVKVQGRHKKQTGGHGQFGDVWIEFEPCDTDGLVFEQHVVGGAVPKGYFPAVEKGLHDSIKKGPLAGYPVVGLKATLYDGSYHPVDSSEMAFKMAATIAYKAGMPKANPILLEPIGSLKAYVPDNSMGDVMGEINKRRGRVLGMNPYKEGSQVVEAEVPQGEMGDFSTFIRQCTQGRGSYTFNFVRYEEVPTHIAQSVIDASKK
jgi:elongation factor G